MKKFKKLVIFLIIIFGLAITSQVNAAELTVEDNLDIVKVNENLKLKDSIKRSKYNEILKESDIEDTYNLKDSQTIRVKNQQKTGSCWAFSFSTLLETSITKQSGKTSKEYSPMHMEYATEKPFNRKLGSGAGPIIATAYCVSGLGPVEESKLPFDSVYDETTATLKSVESIDENIDARIKDAVIFSQIYKTGSSSNIKYSSDEEGTGNYTSTEVEAIRKLIKEHIKKYGAIAANIYMDSSSKYYNSSTGAFNYNEYNNKLEVNHAVTIVGWDDNYDTSNFTSTSTPTAKGAYIVLNSYGTEFGKDGYMYISYEDAYIEQDLVGLTSVEEYQDDDKKDYDKLYQYDELGMNAGLPLGETSLYAANKYTRENVTDKDEYLQEIGLYIVSTSGVEVYINSTDDNIENTKLVATSEKALESGYHTIKLSTPIKLTGNKFVVKVKYTNQEYATIPMEMNFKDSNISDTTGFYDEATANDNECFISKDNKEWADLNNLKVNFSSGESINLKNASTCIKVFTTYQEKTNEDVAVTGVSLNKKQTTLEVGDKETLIATILPENATNKDVKWNSSNENIATVSEETGIVTAKSEGTTTITVVTDDGNKMADCKVTVKAKTNNDDDIYKDNSESSENSLNGNSDKTVANNILPFAGENIVKIAILVLSILLMSTIFIKYRTFKDVK